MLQIYVFYIKKRAGNFFPARMPYPKKPIENNFFKKPDSKFSHMLPGSSFSQLPRLFRAA